MALGVSFWHTCAIRANAGGTGLAMWTGAVPVTIKVPMKFQPWGKEQLAVKDFPESVVAHPAGVFSPLTATAFLEAFGDSLFLSGIYRSAGPTRGFCFVAGAIVLAFYGFSFNLPHWDFGSLLGVYVVLFFLVSQILAKVRFNQSATIPITWAGW